MLLSSMTAELKVKAGSSPVCQVETACLTQLSISTVCCSTWGLMGAVRGRRLDCTLAPLGLGGMEGAWEVPPAPWGAL